MSKVLVISSLFIVLFSGTVFAADSTPSADIASKLKEFQKEAASKAAQLKDLISKKLQNKAFVGTIESQSGNSLTLAAKSGPRIVSLNQDTLFESKVKQKEKFSFKSINTGDYVAALGDIDETGVLTARKVILLRSKTNEVSLTTKNYQLKTYLWGQVISISDELITLRDKTFKNWAATLPESPKVKLNDYVILTGNLDKNNIVDTGFVYVIPQGGVIKPKKLATPSAKIN